MTDSSMERIKRVLVEHATATHRLFARSDFKYEDIEVLDAALRVHIAALRGPADDLDGASICGSDCADIAAKRAIQLSGLLHQRMRLHRVRRLSQAALT